jgi:hypothetical protein
MKKIALISCFALLSLATWATNYYVSPTGSGSNYTLASPGKLTATVIGKLTAGDVLYLRGGQYDLNNNLSITRNGTADKMITICPYEDEKPILDFRTENNKTNGVTVKGNYLHIKGITIRYAGYKGIWLEEAKYCILEQLDVYGCCNAGIQLRSGGHNTVVNCDSHDNFDYQDNGGNADGFADKQGDACPGNVYIGCRSWNNSDDGWDSFQRVTDGTPTVYINCITYNNGPEYFDLSAHPRVLGKDAGLSCFVGKDLSHFANGGNPNGFKLGGQGTKHDTELYRCLAVGHRSKGFDQNNNAGHMKVINCTSYKNKFNYGFGNSYAYTLVIKNCISLSSIDKDFVKYPGATITDDHNTWNTGFSASESDFEGLDIESVINAPRNADGSLAETTQFHLKSTATNLIDKGVNYTDFSGEKIADYVSYKGEAPDLGCYEYDPSTGISAVTVKGTDLNPNMPRYNIKGQQVDSNYKGLVIQGGKKYIQK